MNVQAPAFRQQQIIGKRMPRKEDGRLLTGHGQYTDDVRLPGMMHVAFVRSSVARGTITGLDLTAARDLPGVHAIYTHEDFAEVPLSMMTFFFTPIEAPISLLANGRVACVGDAVAMVIADTRAIAEDAAALVELTIDEEDPVITIADARGGPLVHPNRPENIAAEMGDEDIDEAVQDAFDKAAHVVTRKLRHQRIAQSPMESRACVASYDGMGELTIYISCQSPHLVARYTALALQVPSEQIRVIAKDVGGGFGLKNMPWREEMAVIVGAKLFGKPLKWIEDRFEALTASSHAREQEITLTVAFDGEGKLLAGHSDYHSNNGAWPMGEDSNIAVHMFMWPAYKMPAYSFHTRGWYTNTMGLGGYRGPWAMESLIREVVLDAAAKEVGIDPIEIRRRNLIKLSDQPVTSTLGIEVDDITPYECLEKLVAHLDVPKFRREQAEARKEGRYLGLGFATYIEPTASAGSMAVMTGELAQIRIEPTGKVTASLSTHSQGHGTATTMAQVIAERLGVPYEDVTVFEGDSSFGGFSPGAAGSRQGVVGGGASWKAADLLSDKIKRIAAHLYNANPEAISVSEGVVHIEGAPEMSRPLREVAEIAYGEPHRLPEGLDAGLEAQYRYQPPPMTMTSAAHACIVEIDAETGFVKIKRWVSAEDCGTVINPGIVEGQIAGGLAQAIGQVLLEEMPYDARGNPLAATFKDYLMPTISDIPDFEYIHANTPSKTIGGMRGVGEGGAIVGPPTLVNAINDALSPFGEIALNLPFTPAKILDVIEGRDISGHRHDLDPPAAPAAGEAPAEAAPAASGDAARIDGEWKMVMATPMGPQEMTGRFTTDGGSVSGELMSPEGSQGFTGTVEGNRVKFNLAVEKPMKMTLKYDITVEGDELTGKVKLGMFGSAKLTGERMG